MIDRRGAGKSVGETLLSLSNDLFHHWHRVRDGTLEWSAFGKKAERLRKKVKHALEDGSECGCVKTSGTYGAILKLEESLWTFARIEGVEPTNNAAERALRHAVIWRRVSGGTDSPRGSRFVERMLTVTATCRQQNRNPLDYLTAALEAARRGLPVPSHLPAATTEIQPA